MVLDLVFPSDDLGKRTGATFYEIIDPCPRFRHRQEKNIAILGAHCCFLKWCVEDAFDRRRDRARSPITSRSNWANDSSTFRVSLPMLPVVLTNCVTET